MFQGSMICVIITYDCIIRMSANCKKKKKVTKALVAMICILSDESKNDSEVFRGMFVLDLTVLCLSSCTYRLKEQN